MSKQVSEEENKELNRVDERLKELSKCGLFLDNILIKDKTARQIIISAYNKLEKQQKEIKDWFEIADNILRATNDYGNITIGDIPRYIEKLQKEIEELHKEINRRIKLKIENEKCVDRDFIYKGKIREKIKNIEDIYKKEMKPYQTEYGLNVSLLSKKEKEELINKRNGLLTQKITLEDLLEGN